MLTANMLEKFTKRFQNLTQTSGNPKVSPKQTNAKEPKKESLAQKISSLVHVGDNKLKDLTTGKKVFSQKEQPQIRFYGKEGSDDESDLSREQNSKEESLKSSDQSSQDARPAKRSKILPEKSSSEISQKQEREFKRGQKFLSMQQKQLFYLKVIKQIGEAKSQSQKNEILKKRMKQRSSSHPSKALMQYEGFKILFDARKEIQSLPTRPPPKEISKKIAKKLIIFIQKNINEKRYKLLIPCRVLLKGLNLGHYQATKWLNKLVIQNKHLLKGIKLSEYDLPSSNQKNILPESKKNMSKSKIQVISSNTSKEQSSDREEEVQVRNQEQSEDESYQQQVVPPKQKTKNKQIEEKYIKNNELRLLLGVQGKKQPKKQPKKVPEPPKKQSKKVQSTPPKTSKNKKKQPPKRQTKEKQQIKQERKQDQAQKNQTISQSFNKYSQQCIKEQGKSDLIKQFPEQFMKRIAGKIDNILKSVYKSIIKQQCKELCLEKQIILEIYQQYSQFQKSNLAKYLNEAPSIDYKTYFNQKPTNCFQYQPDPVPIQDNYYRSTGNRRFQNYQAPSNYLAENKIQTNPSDFSMMKVEREDKGKIYEFMKNQLDQFRKIKQNCTAEDIKHQALNIVVSNPEIRRKISEEDFAQWLYRYQQQVEVKKYSQKVSNALEQISQAPRWKIQGKQFKEGSTQVSNQVNSQNTKYVVDEFAKKMMIMYQKN